MSVAANLSRTYVFAENLGDWSWPGRGGAAAEVLPPSWVPALPPQRQVGAPDTAGRPARSRARMLLIGVLLSALAAVCVALAQGGQLTVGQLLGHGTTTVDEHSPAAITAAAPDVQSFPTITAVSQDAAGSAIDSGEFYSASLHRPGSFLLYLPTGYASTNAHYPVLYLLTGHDQSNTDFLKIGLQGELDRLIARHEIPPVIAVMIQGGYGDNNWRNLGERRYESYALEVQELVDRTLPTVPARGARAILGDSMGGYGAMNLALSNPYRFGVVESWLGFFNGLSDNLRAAQPVISRLGMHALIYGADADKIADPSENAPFAAALRAAGADAHSAIYPGEHNLETLEAHLASTLRFAGRALSTSAAASPAS